MKYFKRLCGDDPGTINQAVQLLPASRYLERIADLTTNIAEDVVFMVEGELIWHSSQTSSE